MSVQKLAESVKSAVDKRVAEEAQAMRGTIRNGKFVSGSKSYSFDVAVDCNTGSGSKVWGLPTKNGKVVVVGA